MTRWEVFKQDAAGKPHQAVGSVHAADARHALVTAAHVFARRPSAHSLWVVPVDAIYSRTAQELAAAATLSAASLLDAAHGADNTEGASERMFHVFRKASHRRSMTFVDHVVTLEAVSPAAALARAVAEVPGAAESLAWWVVPVAAVTASAAADAPSWFEPAKDKTYKQQALYGTGPTVPAKRGS
ncbi:MAG TPA: phenylacetic acid degradation protein [Trueperaceae bacterium]|nr:phenylacetic acid degradation protein [Trueperaceae bacterium]